MSADDPKRARSIAFQLVGDLARDHASTLELVSRAEDVETRLAGPLARARARFQKKSRARAPSWSRATSA